ncbi:hypothetical protein [Phaeacidiphilus oryzae]|uniref:hypothetical protein n=1 Tax=Phaeacidiphilus oryzae TaxID=348818 RepID=UPI00056864EF|nr:hypothetical protein [Phaeacidiphilus oryzae]
MSSLPPDEQPQTRTRLPVGDPAAGGAPVHRRLRTLAVVLGVVVVLVVIVAVVNRGNGPGSGATAASGGSADGASSAPTAPTGTNPVSTTSNGIATGFPQTEEGAQSAAANYSVALGSSDMYVTNTRHTILSTIGDPAVTAGLQAQSDQAYERQAKSFGLQNGLPPTGMTFVSRTIPVGTKVDSYDGGKATVEIWANSLGGLAGQGSTNPVTEYWFTDVLQLHWVNGDWKMSGYSQKDGPVPVTGSQTVSNPDSIAGAVNQFGGFRYAR